MKRSPVDIEFDVDEYLSKSGDLTDIDLCPRLVARALFLSRIDSVTPEFLAHVEPFAAFRELVQSDSAALPEARLRAAWRQTVN